MEDIISMSDMQNYYLSFFGGITHPTSETVEELVEEYKKDNKENER